MCDLKRLLMLHVEHPYVEVECGGVVKQSGTLIDVLKKPVFENPLITLDVVSKKNTKLK